jgi:uncharacterized protein (DUF58 family)
MRWWHLPRVRWRPRRTIRPTREGWWCLAVTVGLGLTAMNTGNNLLYLLEAMVLSLIVVSGVLSEQSVRGVRVVVRPPDDVYAEAPCLVSARVRNTKRRRPSFSIGVDRVKPSGRLAYLERLGAGEERLVTWEETFPRRGRHALGAVRVTTRFRFGLFVKLSMPIAGQDVIVYPRRVPPPPALLAQAAGAGTARARRRGRGQDLHDLREYRSGDDPRLIHWRVSARTGTLTVRELEAETAQDAYLVLRGDGARDAARLEQALADAAAVAAALLSRGARVGVLGAGVDIPLGQGGSHARTILTALALYEPAQATASVRDGGPARGVPDGVRAVVVDLG